MSIACHIVCMCFISYFFQSTPVHICCFMAPVCMKNILYKKSKMFYNVSVICKNLKNGGVILKVLLINGSPHKNGNTAVALNEMVKVFSGEQVETEIMHIGNQAIRGCIACGSCEKNGKCVFDDAVNKAAPLFEEADGLIVASPVYYASANATLIAFLDRLFYSTSFDKRMKVGASVVVARRGGLSATFDELNKYFTICGMPVASSQYWNSVHGRLSGEAKEDGEGLQTMRELARNMTFLMKSITLGKEAFGLPQREAWIPTHFIR